MDHSALLLASVIMLVAPKQSHGEWVTWPASAGGNGHSYLAVRVTSPISWNEAFTNAQNLGGYLATLTSAAENDFVFGLIQSPEYWNMNEIGPALGGYQPPGSVEPLGGWTWVTGETWSYSKWAGGQPDNGGIPEDCLHFWFGNQWNDRSSSNSDFISYVVEREVCTPHRAVAAAQVVNGFVVGATILDAGCGYTNVPVVQIAGGGGGGATATAVLSNGQVTAVRIVSAGCCYTNTPRIIISSPPFEPTVSISVSKVRVSQNVVPGRRYVLESSLDLANWFATGPPFLAESELVEEEFDVQVTGRFFRLREVP